MIYTFENRNASIVIIGDTKASITKYKFDVLFGFFNYSKIEKDKIKGVLTKKNFSENTFIRTKNLFTSYELSSKRDKIRIVLNFFKEV